MALCNNQHRYYPEFESLPDDQSLSADGRHKCAGCAYEQGHQLGLVRATSLSMNFEILPDSQAGAVRHKSVQAAFAEGYKDGVRQSYISS
ncbi:hypothetical protein GNP84_18975 [Aliivibrio fischeri]|uniref:hypothetical protein n=1 Tax=Aliivibrio fischeri TaxID=668 RepID=UPI0012D85880|nr:hypothetical protein [Aliivibrio fischeri]MUK78966.1 hypothetical protein [Aliivibrio fischeri]